MAHAPVSSPLRVKAEALHPGNADLIAFHAIDYGSWVPTVQGGQRLGKGRGSPESHGPPHVPAALTSP